LSDADTPISSGAFPPTSSRTCWIFIFDPQKGLGLNIVLLIDLMDFIYSSMSIVMHMVVQRRYANFILGLPADQLESLLDLIFDPQKGLGLNIVRLID